jgi:hypothetical protein
MHITYRQGIIRSPLNFLQLTSDNNVKLITTKNAPVVVTVADGDANYIFTEDTTIQDAWTGPFQAGTTYWLYWDVDIITGSITRSHTTLDPIIGSDFPDDAEDGQMMFNTSTNQMFIRDGLSWIRKIRIFAAKLNQGAIFTSMSINLPNFNGTQIGSLQNLDLYVGYIVYDSVSGYGLRKADNTFFTTEDKALTGISASSPVKFGGLLFEAIAHSQILPYSIVRFIDYNTIEPATNYIIDNGIYGIVDRQCVPGDIAQITIEGIVQNEEWDWSEYPVNTPLYANSDGQLTATVAPTPIIVAVIIDKHSILLRPSSLYINTLNDPSNVDNLGSVLLSAIPEDVLNPIAVGDNDARILSIEPHVHDTDIHFFTGMAAQFSNIIATNYLNIVQMYPSSAEVIWDVNLGAVLEISLTEDTFLLTSNLPDGIVVILKITQDNIGNFNVTFDTNFKSSQPFEVGASPNATTIYTFYSDGINLYELTRSVNLL